MKVSEAIERLKSLESRGHGEDELVIPLMERSIGRHANSTVEGIHAGFDWDGGIVFVTPTKSLISRGKDRDVPMLLIEQVIEGRKRKCYRCSVCEEIVSRQVKYCPNCGQRLEIL